MPTNSSTQTYRPGCVTAYAVLLFLGGALNLLGTLANLGSGGNVSILFIGLLLAGLAIMTGAGLWQMKIWGWWLAVAFQAVAIISSFIGGIAAIAVSLLINGAIFYWFYQNKKLFEGNYTPTEEELNGLSNRTGLIVGGLIVFVVILPICTIAFLTLMGDQIGQVFNEITTTLSSP